MERNDRLIIALSIIALIIIRLPTIGLMSLRSDEPIYINMAQQIMKGYTPYGTISNEAFCFIAFLIAIICSLAYYYWVSKKLKLSECNSNNNE